MACMKTTDKNTRWCSDVDSSMLYSRRGVIRRATAWVGYRYSSQAWDVRIYGGSQRVGTVNLRAIIHEPEPTPDGRKQAQALAEAIHLCQSHGLTVTGPPEPAIVPE